MGFTLKILFHGTVALIPQDGNARAVMLLPEYDTGEFVDLHPIVAYVRFPKGAFDKTNSRPPQSPQPPANNTTDNHVILNHELLVLDAQFAAGNDVLKPDWSKDPQAKTPVNADKNSLFWLPNLERLTTGTGQIDPELLKTPFTRTASPRVAARIDLKNGVLNTPGALDTAVKFITTATSSESLQAIAREAVLTVNLDGNSFWLRSSPIDGSVSDGKNDMKFNVDEGGEITIVIGNEPVDDIYATAEDTELIPSPQAAKEFDLFYKLSKNQADDRALPAGANRGSPHQLCALAVMGGTT